MVSYIRFSCTRYSYFFYCFSQAYQKILVRFVVSFPFLLVIRMVSETFCFKNYNLVSKVFPYIVVKQTFVIIPLVDCYFVLVIIYGSGYTVAAIIERLRAYL